MTAAFEITTFKLAGASCAEFVLANREIDDWLLVQPGFVARFITEGSDGVITDIVLWESIACAESGAVGIATDMGNSPVHALIDQTTVEWRISRVRHSLKLDPHSD